MLVMATKYSTVSDDEKFEKLQHRTSEESFSSTLLEDEDYLNMPLPPRPSIWRNPIWLWLGHGMLLSISVTILFCALYTRNSTLKFVQDFSSYSPAAVAVEYNDLVFDGEMGAGSIYVGASEEVDIAWRNITSVVGDQMISAAELRKIDKPNTVLKVTDPKTGNEGYRVGIEVFHQLHCLNLLRQATFKEYYEPLGGDFGEGPQKLRMHLNHCIEMLRQNLMCEADIGLITFHTIPGSGDDDPWPDFNTHHTCRNFDKVKQWAIDNTVSHDDVF